MVAILGWAAAPGMAAVPSPAQALRLAPTQEGVDYDRPKPDDLAKCKVLAKTLDGRMGWIVESPEGVILRRFVDTNGDNVVDQWSYFKDGVEVYRDIDSKFTGKADQFRWFHTAGTRWGIDTTGNGKIDAWKVISAEEVTAEIAAALASHDADRFARVLLTPDELASLGLGRAKSDAMAAKVAKAAADFQALAARQKTLSPESKWLQFSGGRPGTVPAGTDDSTKDLQVYENVVAIVQAGEKNVQLQLGTLVQVGSLWKAIDAPQLPGEGTPEAVGGLFFQASPNRSAAVAAAATDETQRGMASLEKLDPGDPGRVDILEKIAAEAKTPEDRATWVHQLADTISAAVQNGKMPDGGKRLETLLEKVRKTGDKNLEAYVRLRQLTSGYATAISAPKADVAKIQTECLKSLEQFVADYPTSPDAVEAFLQLGTMCEYAGQDEDAKKWYGRIGSDFPNSPQAKKAGGAAARLDSVGKTITLKGNSRSGGTVDLADYRGKAVLIQYWATWCNPAKNDMAALKELAAKYEKSFTVLGVCLDTNAKSLEAYLANNPLPWPQIFEEGGLDSRPACVFGIITLPTMILVDPQGKVVNRNIQTSEIEAELKKLVP
jgi:thiol-disulfide isomerase/thioredoxin